MLAVGIIFFVLALALLLVGGLSATRKLPGNSVVGLRLAEIRKSKEAWDNAHAVAGPFWLVGGVSLFFGGIVALTASGWMWAIPVLTFFIALIAVSVGSNMGARAAYLWDQAHQEQDGCGDSCNCGDGGCGPTEATATPTVDLGALRKAAERSDLA